ncbi:hypothetical protein [Streptomyces longwoodensis]|uniref:hypothetical protein n=1 Tax=Streptomyces longwoodensis TaxID=68231 RepID=UPI003407F8D1
MTDYTVRCRLSDDRLTGRVDSDGDIRIEVTGGTRYVYATPEQFAAFARNLLADAGADPRVVPIRVGDHVEIVKYRLNDRHYEGLRGRVRSIDEDDIPYLVETDEGAVWCREVRKVAAPEPAPESGSRADHVAQAKRLLAGTTHDAGHILRLAEFLAGE